MTRLRIKLQLGFGGGLRRGHVVYDQHQRLGLHVSTGTGQYGGWTSAPPGSGDSRVILGLLANSECFFPSEESSCHS